LRRDRIGSFTEKGGPGFDYIAMERIGVHYHNEADRELILGYTANHPNLLQFFCKNLVEKSKTMKWWRAQDHLC